MRNPIRPLWRLLLETAVPKNKIRLSCADCFSILEYLATITPENYDWPSLIKKARRHLTTCPDCQAYYEHRLAQLEEMATHREPSRK